MTAQIHSVPDFEGLPADQKAVVIVKKGTAAVQMVAADHLMAEKLERLIRQNPDHPKAAGWAEKLAALKGANT